MLVAHLKKNIKVISAEQSGNDDKNKVTKEKLIVW